MTENGQEERETIRVTITGAGIDFAREVTIDLLPRLIALLVGPVEPAAGDTDTIRTEQHVIRQGAPAVSPAERPVGVAEYIREKRPQTSPDTILVLAAYLELHENRRPFGRDDLRRLMRVARLPEPANFPRDLGVAVSKGYIQPFDEGYQLTNSGMELIGQPGPLVPSRGRAARPRRSTRLTNEES
jgi:hypothetical protein